VVIGVLKVIRRYYDQLAAETRDAAPLRIEDLRPPIVIVTSKGWDRLTEKALHLALSISPDIVALHLTQLSGPEADDADRSLRESWRERVERPAVSAGQIAPRLVIMPAEYRDVHEPILELVRELEARSEGRRIAVLIPEVVKQKWYQYVLHANHARYLRAQLLRYGPPELTVVSIPWRLEPIPRPDQEQANKVGRRGRTISAAFASAPTRAPH
jgi:hypothetical protein